MTYRIDFTTAAARQVKKLPRPGRERVLQLIEALAEDPRPHGARKLVGEETAWRIRAGDYRVIYDVFDDELTVTLVRAGAIVAMSSRAADPLRSRPSGLQRRLSIQQEKRVVLARRRDTPTLGAIATWQQNGNN